MTVILSFFINTEALIVKAELEEQILNNKQKRERHLAILEAERKHWIKVVSQQKQAKNEQIKQQKIEDVKIKFLKENIQELRKKYKLFEKIHHNRK